MTALRRLASRHSRPFGWLLALMLAARLLAPAGFMPVLDHGALTIQLCDGFAPAPAMTGAMKMAHHGDKKPAGKAEAPCAFAGVAALSLAAADPLMLALAIAFVLAIALHRVVPVPPAERAFLRPPLRGPPVAA